MFLVKIQFKVIPFLEARQQYTFWMSPLPDFKRYSYLDIDLVTTWPSLPYLHNCWHIMAIWCNEYNNYKIWKASFASECVFKILPIITQDSILVHPLLRPELRPELNAICFTIIVSRVWIEITFGVLNLLWDWIFKTIL